MTTPASQQVNRKIAQLTSAVPGAARAPALRRESEQLEREIGRLVEALARGTAYDATGEARRDLKAARAELAIASAPSPAAVPPLLASDVTARLRTLWDDLRKLDGDRTRVALRQVFDGIVVTPLHGSWANGWRLEMRTRPWAVLLPRDASGLRLRMVAGARSRGLRAPRSCRCSRAASAPLHVGVDHLRAAASSTIS